MAEVQAVESVEAAAESAKQAAVAAIALNVLVSGAMAQVWGMINGMQIYSNLPMFKVLFPKYSLAAMNEVLEIAEFEVIPVGELLWVVLD